MNGIMNNRKIDNKGWEIGEGVRKKIQRPSTPESTLGISDVMQFHPE